jgi:hypothetical protein
MEFFERSWFWRIVVPLVWLAILLAYGFAGFIAYHFISKYW